MKSIRIPLKNCESIFHNVIQRLERKTKMVRILYFMENDFIMRMKYQKGDISTTSGTFTSKYTLDETLDYIKSLSLNYLDYAEIEKEDIKGKTILEIGPGDNLGVAIMLLLYGAKKVVCIDKFYPARNKKRQIQIYKALREDLDSREVNIFNEIVKLDNDEISFNEEKLQYVCGLGIEDTIDKFEEKSFDFIISWAVMEHLFDPDAAFHAMDKLLADNGCMIHGIDFRDHGIFSSIGMNPLTYLTISDPIWKCMTYHSGKPNRKFIDYYRKKMKELEYDSRILLRRIVGCDSLIIPPKEKVEFGIDYHDPTLQIINEIKPKLRKRYSKMNTHDLIISTIILVGRKV